MSKDEQWTSRKVTFVLMGANAKIDLYTVAMPVRVKSRSNENGVFIYEGPIESMWENLNKRYPEKVGDKHCIGVLVSCLSVIGAGQISWLVSSNVVHMQEGADKIIEERL